MLIFETPDGTVDLYVDPTAIVAISTGWTKFSTKIYLSGGAVLEVDAPIRAIRDNMKEAARDRNDEDLAVMNFEEFEAANPTPK